MCTPNAIIPNSFSFSTAQHAYVYICIYIETTSHLFQTPMGYRSMYSFVFVQYRFKSADRPSLMRASLGALSSLVATSDIEEVAREVP